MKIKASALIVLSLTLGAFSFLNAAAIVGDPAVEKPEHFVQRSDNQMILVDFSFPGVDIQNVDNGDETFDLITLEGAGVTGSLGAPELPVVTKLFAIPDRAHVTVKSVVPVYKTYNNIAAYPHQEYEYGHPLNSAELTIDDNVYKKSAMYPEKWVTIGEPAIFRDYRVIPVNIMPVRVNPVTGEAEVLVSLHLELSFDDSPSANIKTQHRSRGVASFNQMYQNSIANYDWVSPNGENLKGSLLIVYPNVTNVLNTLQPYIQWKKRLGYNVVTAQVSNNTSTTNVKTVIQNNYNSLEIPLEYVVLIGDATGTIDINCYTWNSGWYQGDTDHTYALLEGGDVLADVALGRISVSSVTELQTAINKILYYEQNPTTNPTSWYKKGMVVAGSSSSGISTIFVGRVVRSYWLEDGFTQVDTMWYNMGGSIPTTMTNVINSGISALNFRGYIGTSSFTSSSVMALNNPGKLPFGVVITCGTGNFGSVSNEISESWLRAGSPTNPTGGIGGIGTATSGTHTRYNNTMAMGLWFGLHSEGLTQLGTMVFRGKLELFNSYQNDQTGMQDFTYWNNLMGDPSTDLWNNIPQTLTVTHPTQIPLGTSSFTLTVTDPAGNPLPDRYVTLWKGDETFVGGRTNATGVFTSNINVPTAGTLLVTVTNHNDRPYLANVTVVQTDVCPSFQSVTIDDDNLGASSGNNNGQANPSENIELDVILKNYGNAVTASGITAALSCADSRVTLLNTNATYPDLNPGLTAYGNQKFAAQLSSDFTDGYIIPFTLTVNSNQGQFVSAFDVEVTSAGINITSSSFAGGILNPGASTNFNMTLRNTGSMDLTGVTAVLTSDDDQVTVVDGSSAFGSIAAGATATNASDLFVIQADEWATRGRTVDYNLHITTASGYSTDVPGQFIISSTHSYDPMGPDEYGYYVLDNTDIEYAGAPVYSWIDIHTSGTQLTLNDYGNEQDASTRIVMPFDFTMYGETNDTLTVCSNGWLALGNQSYITDFRNYSLPCAAGPNSVMISPYWDDLVMGGGHVYYQNFPADHKFVVQYYNVSNMSGGGTHNFEVILYDPEFYPTPTGDGIIQFQYAAVTPTSGSGNDNPYFTTGIMNDPHTVASQYAYWNSYGPASPPLQSGRAIKFTTAEPLRQPLAHDFDITLTPSGTIVIPQTGGSFSFSFSIVNQGTMPEIVDIWSNVTLPNGTTYGPVLLRNNVTMASGQTLMRNLTQNVPASAPAGAYTYNAYCGDYSATVYAEDHFDFTKTGVDGTGSGDWILSGWGDDYSLEMYSEVPLKYELGTASPNPFNPTTDISYALPHAGRVTLAVYNTLGRQIALLEDGYKEAGWHTVTFNGADLSSGIYFYTIKADGFTSARKMMLVK